MQLLDRIVSKFGYIPEKKDSGAPTDEEPHSLETSIPKEIRLGTDKDFANTYQDHVWVYACVDAIAQAASKIPILFRTKLSDGSLREDNQSQHPVARLHENPNPFMSSRSLREAVQSYLHITGNSYTELVRDDPNDQWPVEMYPLNSVLMEIRPDAKRQVSRYLLHLEKTKEKGRTVPFSPREVMHIKFFNPKSDFYGWSPIAAAGHSVVTDLYAIDYNKWFYQNAAIPGGVLETEKAVSNRAWRRLIRTWRLQHKGKKRSHRLAILEEGLKYRQTSIKQKDMDFLEQRRLNMREILAVYRVTPIILGVTEGRPFATANIQKKQFYEEAILPANEKWVSQINTQMLPPDPTNPGAARVVAVVDEASIEALKEDKDKQAVRFVRLVKQGILTINEARGQLGLKPVDWGDMWWAPANMMPIGNGDDSKTPFPSGDDASYLVNGEVIDVEAMVTRESKDLDEPLLALRSQLDQYIKLLTNGSGR